MPSFYVKVRRTARPPLPWTWEIYAEGDPNALQQSVAAYRSAEDALAAGNAALAATEHEDR